MVRIRGLTKSYGSVRVLDDLSLDISAEEKVAIIGPSGSGKTTILRCVMTIEQPDFGTIEVGGHELRFTGSQRRPMSLHSREMKAYRSKIGMVFQHFNLFPHLTVLQNIVEAPIHVLGLGRDAATRHAGELLQLVGLRDKAGSYPSQLSGGQQQRVAIARALAMQPSVMLFDEVTSALDPELVGEVLNVIRTIAKDRAMTMIIVTHEMSFARDVAHRIIFLEAGRIVEEGPPEVIFTAPTNDRTRTFLRRILER